MMMDFGLESSLDIKKWLSMAFHTPNAIQLRRCLNSNISSRGPRLSCNLSREASQNQPLYSWRTFRSQLVASECLQTTFEHPLHEIWAHEISTLETGCCIISTDTNKWSPANAHYNKAVILVTAMDTGGITGILLTFPSRWCVGNIESVMGRIGKEFIENIVFIGGDCEFGTLQILHGQKELVGAEIVFEGLYRGGINECRELVKKGLIDREEVLVFLGYVKFGWDRWNKERNEGKWKIVACSEKVILEKRRTLWNTINDLL